MSEAAVERRVPGRFWYVIAGLIFYGSLIVPVPVVPPTVSSTVSFGSSTVSLVVGTVTVKLVTPAGTVKLPPLNVTPLLKVALANAVKSPALAVLAPPPSVAATTSPA